MHDYTLIRSGRKTIGLRIKDSMLEVRAPLGATKEDIDRVVASKEKWISDKLSQTCERLERRGSFMVNYGDDVLYLGVGYPIASRSGDRVGFDDNTKEFYIPPHMSPEGIKAAVIQVYKMLAKRDLANKVSEFANEMNVKVASVKINSAKTRWGSCSARPAFAGSKIYNINFSWRLIMADEAAVDYVVVHELAHIKEMNHSPRFWAIVESVLPDYKQRQARLKELQKRLGNEDWDISAVEEERDAAAHEAGQYRWHYADYKTILSPKNGMNLYRGCTHGCIYCDSRSVCYQMNHDFEDIEVKRNAAEILERQLRQRRTPCMIVTGAMGDPYIHLEEELQITRRCLEIIERRGFGVAILTKSARIMRDIDLLYSINVKAKCVVQMTLTTFDEDLCRILEPNVSTTAERFAVLDTFRKAEIPTVVWMCPILPFINDTEENLRALLDYCIRAGVKGIIVFGFGTTMREGSRDHFYRMLDLHFPGMKQKYIEKYGNKYECHSANSSKLSRIFKETCDKHGILHRANDVFDYIHSFKPNTGQISLFDI